MAEETIDTLETQIEEHEKSDQEFGNAFEAASKDEPSEEEIGKEEDETKEEQETKAKEETEEKIKEEKKTEEEERDDTPPDLDFLSKEDRDALSEAEKHVPGLRKIVARTKSWDGRLRKSTGESVVLRQQLEETQGLLNEERSKKAPTKEEREEEPTKVELSEEEQEALTELENEYPVLHKAVQTLLKKATTEIVTEHVQPIKDKEAKAAKAAKDQEDEETRIHFEAIAGSHPDFLDIVNSGDLDAWIQGRSYSEAIDLMEVRNGGNAEQVIGLLDRYKEERTTGKTSEADAAKEAKEKEAKSKEEADRKAKREKDLAASQAVRHRSGGPPPGKADKDDFDGAFAEAVNQSR